MSLVEAGTATPSLASAPPTKRLLYLDNLKTFLTIMVIIHHVTCSFVGSGWYYNLGAYDNAFRVFGNFILSANQAHFMCMFFFISGYFTPSSFAKKGKFLFLKDKFIRLGILYIVFWLGLSFLLQLMYKSPGFAGATDVDDPEPRPALVRRLAAALQHCLRVHGPHRGALKLPLPRALR